MSRARIHIDFDEGFFDEVLNSPNVRAQVDLAANRMLAEARSTPAATATACTSNT